MSRQRGDRARNHGDAGRQLRGGEREYRGTACGVSADVWRIAGDDVLVVSDALEGADVPSDEALAALVASINARLDHALRVVATARRYLPSSSTQPACPR